MPKYLMSFPRSNASAMLEYNDLGFLVKYELDPGSFGQTQFEYFISHFPKTLQGIQSWTQQNFANVKVKLVEEDLSFENFYNLYGHKVSKKSRSEEIWKRMPDTEKAKAIKYISVYDQRIRQTGINKKYPETYLNAHEWNN